jgi:hypothetical protein
LELVSALFAIAAAILWFRSATVATPGGYPLGLKQKELGDLSKSVAKQSWWSAWAAVCAGVAAIFQAAVIVLSK